MPIVVHEVRVPIDVAEDEVFAMATARAGVPSIDVARGRNRPPFARPSSRSHPCPTRSNCI
jgi:hypothetical protein